MSFYIRFDKAGRTLRFDTLRIRMKGQAMAPLTLEEFAEQLRVNGTGDEHRWGDAILDLTGEVAALEDDADNAARAEADAKEALEAVRCVLVEAGALDEGDNAPLAPLVRALLS